MLAESIIYSRNINSLSAYPSKWLNTLKTIRRLWQAGRVMVNDRWRRKGGLQDMKNHSFVEGKILSRQLNVQSLQ